LKPRIAITLGDPAGIGPEIVAKARKDPRVRRACDLVVTGRPARVPMGRPSRQAGLSAIQALNEGLSLVQRGDVEALVTAPVSKESFRLADHGFPGHTEWLACACRTPEAAMLMVAGPLRAILLTRHVPLSKVSAHLTPRLIRRAAELGYAFIKNYVGKAFPRLVACGVNPHAGDHGIIGKEEQTLFAPALRALKRKGIHVAGPLPADSVFSKMAQGQYDLALAAYHDQGMIPLKLYAPQQVVNVTLGLPFVRTSPGHGTAYDIAGRGQADARPMVEAILLAAQFVKRGA
jgi:4-hydroxythreonine-4-phosphate dehydrogenase